MNDRQRIQLAAVIANRTAAVGRVLDTVGSDGRTVIARMRDAQGGLRAKSYEGTPGTVRRDASFLATVRGDQAAADERELDLALTRLARDTNTLVTIIERYPVPKVPRVDRRGLGIVGPTALACANCAGIEGPAGGPRFEPVRSDLAGPTTVGGRLDEPVLLCAWCYGCVRDWGRVPTPAELERHHRGLRVSWPDDVERPA